jgi:hypothetical protein
LIGAAILTVVVGWGSKLMTMGWVTIFMGPLYLGVGCVHVFAHVRYASRSFVPPVMSRAWLSNGLFLLAFLLQSDIGDNSTYWMTIMAPACGRGAACVPAWWPAELMNAAVFAPVVASWLDFLSATPVARPAGQAADAPAASRSLPTVAGGIRAAVSRVPATVWIVAGTASIPFAVARIPEQPQRLLSEAAARGDMTAVDRLIAQGAQLNDPELLRAAVMRGDLETLRGLVQRGAPVNGDGQMASPLWWAASKGDLEIARELIDLGADVNFQPSESTLPLQGTVHSDNFGRRIAMAELLLEHGADVNRLHTRFRDCSGATPFHSAAVALDHGLVSLFLANGADLNATAEGGRTPERCVLELLDTSFQRGPQVEAMVQALRAR